MAKDRRQLSREQIREYLKKSDETGNLDQDAVEDKDLKQLAKSQEKASGKRKSAKDRLGNTISTMTKVTGNFTGTIAGTLRAEFESNDFKNRITAFAMGLGVVAVVFTLLSIAPVGFIEKPIHDAKMKLRPTDPPEMQSFMHLDIDDKSISTVGRWPWNRDKWANILYGAKAAGIDQVIFDVEFYDPQSPGIDSDVVRLLAEEELTNEEFSARVKDALIDYDEELAKAVRETGNVYMAMHFNRDGNAFRQQSRSIAWNLELFNALALKIDEKAKVSGLMNVGRTELHDLMRGLSHDGVTISNEQADSAAQNEMTSIQSLYCYLHVNRWYAAHPELIRAHMDAWVADWESAYNDRMSDVYADFSPKSGEAKGKRSGSIWDKSAKDQLHRAYTWYRMVRSQEFNDTPWVLDPTVISGYDPKNYDAWQVSGSHTKTGIPFYNDFEFVPAIYQMAAHSRGVGYVSIEHDDDGTVRAVPLFSLYRNSATGEDHVILQLAFLVMLRETDADFSTIKVELGSHVSFRARPELMSAFQAPNARSVPEAGEDGRAEFSLTIDDRGALTINWAGSPSRPASEIFGHLPVTNILEVGERYAALKEYQQKFSAAWKASSKEIEVGATKHAPVEFFNNYLRVGTGVEKKTQPFHSHLGLTGQRFYEKFDEAFAEMAAADRITLKRIVRDEIIALWTSDQNWWAITEAERKDRAKDALDALVSAIAEKSTSALADYAAKPEWLALFDPKQNPWKSGVTGALGVLNSPIDKEFFRNGAIETLLASAKNEELGAIQLALLRRSLAFNFDEVLAVEMPTALANGGEAAAPLRELFEVPARAKAAIVSFQTFSDTKETTIAKLEAAGIDENSLVVDGTLEVPFYELFTPLLDKRDSERAKSQEGLAPLESALDASVERVKPWVDGRLALIGAAATGLGDTMPTPLHENFPGPGIHSNLFNTMVHHVEMQSAPKLSLLLGLLFAVVICVVASRFNVISGVITFSALTLGYLVLDALIQSTQRSFLDTTRNFSSLFMPFLTIQIYRYAVEYRAKLKIKGQFAKFLSPQAVEEIQKNPDALKLGGDEAEMCVYFSDIAGFTPISETMTAPRLIDWLNEYMTRMCEPIRASDGYVDKFIGDAVMAFWGKPNPCTDYSARGCKAAIAVKQELKIWNRESIARGIPEAGTRIGLASGMFVAGNMGTEWKINFTAIGDTVNTGARLEGANKQYGTQIMINELCYQQAKDVILAHPLDLIAVKGKKKGVAVYHLISTTDIAEPDHVKGARIYTEAFEAYQRQEWKIAHEGFRESKEFLPGPYLTPYGPYDQMMERCQHLIDADLEGRMKILGLKTSDEEWDGVWRLTSK